MQLVARQPLELVILVRVQAPEPPPTCRAAIQEDSSAKVAVGGSFAGIPVLGVLGEESLHKSARRLSLVAA